MSRAIGLLGLTLLLALTLSACAGIGMKTVSLKGQTFKVEIADDNDKRVRGLMFREQMPEDHGMLFVFGAEGRQAFWMKNTRIPLDILYFDSAGRFVSGQYNVPTCTAGDRCPNFPSEGPALFVLELNAGVGKRLGLKAGDRIELPAGLRSRD